MDLIIKKNIETKQTKHIKYIVFSEIMPKNGFREKGKRGRMS